MFADICSAFTIIVSFILNLNVSDPTPSQLKLNVLFTASLVLLIDAVTLNIVTRRSPTNNGFSIQVHGRPFLFVSTKTNIQMSPIHHSCSRSSWKFKNSSKHFKLIFYIKIIFKSNIKWRALVDSVPKCSVAEIMLFWYMAVYTCMCRE